MLVGRGVKLDQVPFYFVLSIAILLAVFAIHGCNNEKEPLARGVKAFGQLVDAKKQEQFIEKLKDEDIYFELSERNHILYKVSDTKKLLRIMREVLYGDYLDPAREEAIAISSSIEKKRYVTELNKKGVPYTIVKSEAVVINGSKFQTEILKYSQSYGPQVDDIVHKIYDELYNKKGTHLFR